MSTLWIVHRNPQRRMALARIAGRAANEIVSGGPSETEFADQTHPSAVLLGIEDDFERELEFVHRMRPRLGACSWILLAAEEDANEAARLFALIHPTILESLPSARVLRAHIAGAFARRDAESLVERRSRGRIAERFSTWLGGVEIPGLLRALDPSLGHLPLLVRGVPGSGRALLARYVELFRAGPSGPSGAGTGHRDLASSLRVHARDVTDLGDLAQRIAIADTRSQAATLTVWIDEVDRLPVSAQNALAQWIVHETAPGTRDDPRFHWLATAGPSAWQDPLEPALERAFAPLVIEIPALRDEPDALPNFANEIARDWSRAVGGAPRHLGPSALAELANVPWQGDRSEVEAVLRATFASTNRDPIEAEDLRIGGGHANGVPLDVVRADTPDETRVDVDGSGDGFLPDTVSDALSDTRSDDLSVAEVIATDEETPDADDAELEPARWFDEAESALEPDAPSPAPDPTVDESLLLSDESFDLAASQGFEPGADSADSQDTAEPGDSAAQEGEAAHPDPTWRRLARSLSHEIRNPLVSIRTFAELLPEHYADETFRARFADLVGRDVAHIDDVVTRLQNVTEHEEGQLEPLDVSTMIEELLEERRERITNRRLLVLRELERDAPMAWAQPIALRVAIAGLLDRALDSLPERGDLFVATRRIERSRGRDTRLRILLRHHNPDVSGQSGSSLEDLRPESNLLEYVLAETVARASGGSLTIDSSDAQESLILLELRTPD
jgi:DNA-binding NtrC family response regulator